jgi:glycosyltransferase involved in cell wall biosynthesis
MENPLVHNRDIILFGLQPWDIAIGSNFKNMALEMAKHNRVLYVNRPLDRISYLKKQGDPQIKARIEAFKEGKNLFTEVTKNLWAFNPRLIVESINFLPPGFVYNTLNRRNNKKLAKEIVWAAGELHFKDYIVVIDNDFFHAQYLKEFIDPPAFIYYIRDFLLSQQYFMRHGHKAESALMKKADAVVANSQYLSNYAGRHNKHAADIGQGCDVEDFLEQPETAPRDMAGIHSPVIGYCGSLTATRLDITLIHFIATEKPDWNIVLVGPEDDAFRRSALHGLANVHFTGAKDPAELPGYVHAFDVCINPQVLNQMTIGNYPRKVDEYLAAGKPVVATKTEAMEIFAQQVYLCTSKEEYIGAISKAIEAAHDREKIAQRKELARSHTWQASVNGLYQMIIKLDNERNGR